MEIQDSNIPKPFGLINTGVLCYFNSLIQMLLGSSAFCKRMYYNSNEDISKKFITMLNDTDDVRSSIDIWKEVIKKTKGTIFGQEDATEFFTYLVESLSEDIQDVFKIRYVDRLVCTYDKLVSEKRDNMFFIVFNQEHKPINEDNSFSSIIKAHITIIDDYKCDKCNRVINKRYYQLCKLSSIIVIIFPQYYQKKLFKFDNELEFKSTDNTKYKYSLVSQIEHFGGMNGGHYICRSIRSDNNVYMFNDTSVSLSSFEPTENTYVLMYVRIM